MPTEQIDWVEMYARAARMSFSELRKARAMTWAEMMHLAMQRKHWLRVPVSQRPRRAIAVFAKYHASKALLRRIKRQMARLNISPVEVK